jgi:hypothetical protein
VNFVHASVTTPVVTSASKNYYNASRSPKSGAQSPGGNLKPFPERRSQKSEVERKNGHRTLIAVSEAKRLRVCNGYCRPFIYNGRSPTNKCVRLGATGNGYVQRPWPLAKPRGLSLKFILVWEYFFVHSRCEYYLRSPPQVPRHRSPPPPLPYASPPLLYVLLLLL